MSPVRRAKARGPIAARISTYPTKIDCVVAASPAMTGHSVFGVSRMFLTRSITPMAMSPRLTIRMRGSRSRAPRDLLGSATILGQLMAGVEWPPRNCFLLAEQYQVVPVYQFRLVDITESGFDFGRGLAQNACG